MNIILFATPRELGFSERGINCCEHLGVLWIGDLVHKTEAELLRVPNMGRKTLREVISSLAKYGLRLGLDNPAWESIDPRAARTEIPGGIRFALSQLEDDDQGALARDLQEEIRASVAKIASARNLSIVVTLWGLDGAPRKILEEVGQRYGMTRERVRQIEAKVIGGLRARWHKLPLFDAALASLESHSPLKTSDIAAIVRQSGIETREVSFDALIKLCEVFERPMCLFQANDLSPGIVGTKEDVETLRKAVRSLRADTSSLGCTSVTRIQFELSGEILPDRAIMRGLELLDEVVWLDADRQWLLSGIPSRNRIFNLLEKIFSVSKAVHLSELRQAIGRPHRMRFVPPVEVLGSLCVHFGLHRSVDNIVSASTPFNFDLGELDSIFVKVLQRQGSPITREELEEGCVGEEGMNIASFYQYLSYCPLVLKLDYSVYSLIGASIPPGAIEGAKRRVGQDRVPAQFGWTQFGKLWFVFRLTRASVHSGNFFVPTFISEHAEGKWTLQLASGTPVGEAEVKQGIAGGTRSALQLLGADANDYCLLRFDLSKNVVSIEVGGPDLEDRASEEPPPKSGSDFEAAEEY